MAFLARLARDIGLTPKETAIFRKLSSPEKIQDFLDAMPSNLEAAGDTCHSVRSALRANRCHCIEAAFIAACALMLHGRPALLMDFQAERDDDHVVALFRDGAHWGCISKSNSIWLRWRDPVYKSLRELAMSYFHEFVKGDRKTLRRISGPFDVGAYRPEDWITNERGCWAVAGELDAAPHLPLLTPGQGRRLRRRDAFEVKTGRLREFDTCGHKLA